MSQLTVIFFCAFGPSLAWLGYFWLRDEYSREPVHLVLLVFGGGLLAGPLALLLFEAVERVAFYDRLTELDSVPEAIKLAYCLGAIGPVEELAKFFVFWLFVRRKHLDLEEPIDGVVYAAAAALGFATMENWFHMLLVEEPVWSRAIVLPFNHVLFSSFWGVAVGLEVSGHRHGSRLVAVGIALAAAYHGLYDYFTVSSVLSHLLVAPLVLLLWIWLSISIRELLKLRGGPTPAEAVSPPAS